MGYLMTPQQLELASAFESVTFRGEDKKFATAFVATAKKNPGIELTDKQDRFIRDLAFRYRRQIPIGLVIAQVQHAEKTVRWIAPELAKTNIIKDEHWVADSAAKAVALFQSKSLHQCAMILASLHPFAYDYLAQAPVIVLAISRGTNLSKGSERKRVSREWVSRFEAGGKLRVVMEAAQVAYAFRKLHPSILEADQWETIELLSKLVDASTLSQIIPAREDQKDWLRNLRVWHTQMGRRFQNRELRLEWAARQFNPDNMRRLNIDVREALEQAGNLADFAGQAGQVREFNTRWNLAQALVAQRAWHEELARARNDQRFYMQHGHGWEEQVDYTPLPIQWAHQEYLFTALRSGKELYQEGRDMHHCVGSYSDAVLKGRSRIYHVHDREADRRICTVEFDFHKGTRSMFMADDADVQLATISHYPIDGEKYLQMWHMVQAKGIHNAPPHKETMKVIKLFEERINYFAALFEHEKRHKREFEVRLAKVMLEPPPMLVKTGEIQDGEFALSEDCLRHVQSVRAERAKRGERDA